MMNNGNPWHGTIRHTELKELSFKDVLNNDTDTFPAALSDVLVLPNLVSLLIDLEGEELIIGRLLIIPIKGYALAIAGIWGSVTGCYPIQ